MQKTLFELAEMNRKFTLHLDKVGTTLIHVRPLGFEDLVEGLRLQAALRDGEIDKRGATANIWREVGGRVACREVHAECWREIDLLLAKLDKGTATSLLVFLVENVV